MSIIPGPVLQTLASFNEANGSFPLGGLFSDADGNLFGTTYGGGASGYGTVFEIAKSGFSYGPVQTLASFNSSNGSNPVGGLIADAAGNLFGTTNGGGESGFGTVFEIAKSGSNYGPVQTLVSFNNSNGAYPYANLITDAAGDLFGTTVHGGNSGGYGTVFEIAKSGAGYGTVFTLANFNSSNGSNPYGNLITDAAGDLFGTTSSGGSSGDYGTVFEIAKSGSSYGPVQTLTSFNSSNGSNPYGNLITDAAGDLFGTTYDGGASGYGTVFEIAKSGSNYGPVQTLVSFDFSDGAYSVGSLIIDAAGDLFGTTDSGGASGNGTVFEIAKNGSSYGPIQTLVSFDHSDGAYPAYGSLIVDADGNLFGTTNGGGNSNAGTVFEITNSGYQVSVADDWQGPGGTAGAPTDGDFLDGTNWSSGAAPGSTSDAVLGAGAYTVTAQDDNREVHSLSIGAGATLSLLGTSETLQLDADSSNAGTLDLEGSVLAVQASLTNQGAISSAIGGAVSGGQLQNQGTITATGGSLGISSETTNGTSGRVIADNGSVVFSGGLANQGVVSAINGGLVLSLATSNLAAGVLTGGRWVASGNNSVITLEDPSAITELGAGAAVSLTGSGSVIETTDGSGNETQLGQSLLTIAAGARLQVFGGHEFAAAHRLTIAGVLQLGTGSLLSGHDIDGPGRIVGTGTVSSWIVGAGGSASALTIQALGGALTLTGDNVFSGALIGAGTLQFAAGSDLLAAGTTLTAKTTLVSGATVTLGESLTDNYAFGLQSGTVDLDGNVLTLQGATTLSSGSIEGSSASLLRFIGAKHSVTSGGTTTIAPNVLNSGSIAITGGALHLEGNLTGTGGVVFDATTGPVSLEIGGTTAAGQTIDLNGNTAVSLIVDRASTFKGSLANLAAGDTIDLANVASKSTTLTFDKTINALDVNRGGRTVAALKLAGGTYDASQFSLSADTHAGSLITFHGVSA